MLCKCVLVFGYNVLMWGVMSFDFCIYYFGGGDLVIEWLGFMFLLLGSIVLGGYVDLD